jgi:hypothetical protein
MRIVRILIVSISRWWNSQRAGESWVVYRDGLGP